MLCLDVNWLDAMETRSSPHLAIQETYTPAFAGTCPHGRWLSSYVARAPTRWEMAETVPQNFMILYPAEKGALTQLYAATAPEGEDLNGKVG